MKRKDDQATMDQQFLSPDSYVTMDGREILAGKDWTARKYMVWCRAHGKCEIKGCSNAMDDAHHIIPRSKGRNDLLENLMAICRHHHILIDRRQVRWSRQSSAE